VKEVNQVARSRGKSRRRIIAVSTAGLLALGLCAVTYSARAETIDGTLDYVALGDSYSSGHGASTSYVDNSCKRSAAAYPGLVFDRYKAAVQPSGTTSFTSVACTGAKIQDVLGTQLSSLTSSTDLVTITIGGNDMDFGGIATTCVLNSSADCTIAINDAEGKVESLRAPLTNLFQKIRTTASSFATIVVSGYPLIFDTGDCGALAISEDNRDHMRSLQTRFNTMLEETSTGISGGNVPIAYAQPDPLFETHRVCDTDRWINEVGDAILNGDVAGAYHPNAIGQTAMGEAIVDAALGAVNK